MALLLELYLGHLLGDFVLQPGWLVAAKRDGVWGLLLHVALIGLCTAVILGEVVLQLWNIVLLAMAAHLAIEVVTIRIRATSRISGLSVFLIDQGLHVVSLVVLVWLASQLMDIETVTAFGVRASVPALALACATVAAAFMGAIVCHEVTNVFGPDSKRRVILPFDWARVYGMLERVTALFASVLVNPAFLVLPFLPRFIYLWRRSADEKAYQMIIAATGLIMVAMGWVFVALITLANANVS